MPVSISKIFDVQGRVIAPNIQGLSLDICAFSQNKTLPASCVMNFSDYEDVLSFFGDPTEPECQYANIYFKGFNGSTKKPKKLLMSRWVNAPISAFMISQTLPSIAEIKLAGNSECDFHLSKLDGTLTTVSVTNFDLSDTNSYSGLAQKLTDAINTITAEISVEITYNSGLNTFEFYSLGTGVNSKMLATTYPSGGTLNDLGITLGVANPQFLSQGEDSRTVEENIQHITECISDFVGFVSFFDLTEPTSVEVAQYLDTLEEDYVFFAQTLNPSAKNPNDSTALKALVENYKNVFVQFGQIANVVFASSIGACINYDTGTTINWAFRQQTGLVPDVNNDSDFDNLLANGYNFYATYGLKASQSDFLYNGNITGIYNFVDSLYNAIWLKDSLQRDLVNLFTNVAQISYTPQGYSLIKSALQNSINLALNNGTISLGVKPSSQQIIEIIQEFGSDISGVLEANGYLLIVDAPSAEIRINRGSPICKLPYMYGGKVNKIVLETIQIQ